MATSAETRVVNAAGVVQGITVTFPARARSSPTRPSTTCPRAGTGRCASRERDQRPFRGAGRDLVRRPARRRRRGGRWAADILGRRPQVLDGYGADELCRSGRGQVLIPWPNRLEDGSYEFDGRRHQAPVDDPAENDAIHGLVRWASWAVGRRTPESVAMEHLLHPRPGYPFSLALRIEYTLSDTGLSVTTTATNVGPDPCPYGCGSHPYLTLGTRQVDSLVLRAPAARSCAPTSGAFRPGGRRSRGRSTTSGSRGPSPPRGSTAASPTSSAARTVSPASSSKTRRAATRSRSGPTAATAISCSSRVTRCRMSSRRSLAVEPMSCPPNAFRSGEGLVRLEPGASFTSAWGIAPHRAR